MQKKPKYKPEISRVKLSPEQAVLVCPCYDVMFYSYTGSAYSGSNPKVVCSGAGKGKTVSCTSLSGNAAYATYAKAGSTLS